VNSNTRKGKYPYTRARVFISVATAALSVILAVLLLEGMPILLLYYILCTFLIAATIFMLNVRMLSIRMKSLEEQSLQTEKGASQWKALILLFCMLLLFMFAPLLLTRVLSPEIWFIIIVSFTSGASIAEIFFYLKTR